MGLCTENNRAIIVVVVWIVVVPIAIVDITVANFF